MQQFLNWHCKRRSISTAAPALTTVELELGGYLERACLQEGGRATGILANERNAHWNIECKFYSATYTGTHKMQCRALVCHAKRTKLLAMHKILVLVLLHCRDRATCRDEVEMV